MKEQVAYSKTQHGVEEMKKGLKQMGSGVLYTFDYGLSSGVLFFFVGAGIGAVKHGLFGGEKTFRQDMTDFGTWAGAIGAWSGKQVAVDQYNNDVKNTNFPRVGFAEQIVSWATDAGVAADIAKYKTMTRAERVGVALATNAITIRGIRTFINGAVESIKGVFSPSSVVYQA